MGYVDAIVVELILKFLDPTFKLLDFLLTTLPTILFAQNLLDTYIVADFTSNNTHCLVQVIFHCLVLQTHLHNFFLSVSKHFRRITALFVSKGT
jgi:hypothetical protein